MRQPVKQTIIGVAVFAGVGLAAASSLYLTAPTARTAPSAPSTPDRPAPSPPTRTASVDCEDLAVVNEVVNRLSCSGDFWVKCEGIGFQSLNKLDGQTREQIRQHIVKATGDADPRVVDAFVETAKTIPQFIQAPLAVTDDFNPRISKYSCHLSFRLNRSALEAGIRMATLIQTLTNPMVRAAEQDQLKTSGSSNIVELTMKMAESSIQAKVQRNLGNREAAFTIQSSSQGGYLLDLVEVDKIQ